MRFAFSVGLVALVATFALAQEVRLSLTFVPGSSATRVVTGKVSGEWNGPTPLSPTKPTSFLFDLSVRAENLLTVARVTPEGDGVIVVAPRGVEVKGTAAEQPFELLITPDGDLKFSWGALSFDSAKLPEADRKKLQQLLTLSHSVTISPQGKIKDFQISEAIKEIAPQLDTQFINAVVTATLQTLLPAPLPAEPVKVGKGWEINLPVLAFETPEPLSLPISCTLAEVRGDEAVVKVRAEAKGEANLTLRRWSEKDPKVTVTQGEFSASGEVIFLLSVGVPQRATWRMKAEAEGFVTPPEKGASPVPFKFRLSAEIREHLVF
jgi:hypothetical protein